MAIADNVLTFGWEHPVWSALLSAISSLLAYIAYILLFTLLNPSLFSNLREVPGPTRQSFLWGSLPEILEEEPGKPGVRWMDEYGSVIRYTGFFGEDRLLLCDPTALNHVLVSRSYDYPKPDEVRGDLAMILGKGILFAEGDDHRRQRRIMNPSFSPAHLRELVPIFFHYSHQLRDQWKDLLVEGSTQRDENAFKDKETEEKYYATAEGRKEGELVLNVVTWLNKLTLDIIGDAGFGYEFHSLTPGSTNALGRAFNGMFSPSASARRPSASRLMYQRILGKLVRAVPILKIADWIPNERIRKVNEAFKTVERESNKIIEYKMGDEVEKDGVESVRGGKDLIALLLKSTQGEGKARMTQEELRGQLTTFLLAGHETTSTATTWTLLALAEKPQIQTKLRDEIRQARRKAHGEGRDELDSRELDALPYLDAVCREILRYDPPVTATIRHSAVEDHIPLSKPVRSASNPNKTISSIPVKKGQVIFVPIYAMNHSKEIFGPDASEFRPERWIESENGTGRKIEGGAGVWSNLLTFIAGPRSCIGYKFAVLELKAILSVLVDTFQFDLREPDFKVERRSIIVTRPLVKGEEADGNKLPLRVSIAPVDD
ncbi:hypothetical protein JCM10908_000458 [Rhodotorula pacifica]|uniref:cytochrome P450 n=1 Tax=Rhodotorula pacifica TaxID=1495444 RepID=UPI00316EE30E